MTTSEDRLTVVDEDHLYDQVHQCKKTSSHGSAIRQIISQFRVGMDLTSIACPAFILKPISLLEMNADNMTPLDCLCAASKRSDPKQRMLDITKWLLAGCAIIPQHNLDHAKPFNPILGERFQCSWENGELFLKSHTEYKAEQVSHHPPISAAYMHNEQSNFKVTCVSQPKITFHGNWVEMKLMGSNKLTLTNLDEEYDITLPPVNVCGLILGKCKIEYGKQLLVKCKKTRTEVAIDMKSKNEIKGDMTIDGQKVYHFHGHFHGRIHAKLLETGEESTILDWHKTYKPKKQTSRVTDCDEMDSRRVWHSVTKAIVEGDLNTCTMIKNTIEEEQRAIRKQTTYEPVWFRKIDAVSEDGVQLYEYKL
jgi:hypothetical protein